MNILNTVTCCLARSICSEEYIVRQLHHCGNIIEGTCTSLCGIAYYTPWIYDIGYMITLVIWYSLLFLVDEPVQSVTVVNIEDNSNTIVYIYVYKFISM